MGKKRQLSNEELAAFCSQLSILIHAAITPLESMRILISDTEEESSQALLKAIHDRISEGSSLSEAMESTGVFPDYVINTLKLGEESGSTDDILMSLADYYEREVQIQEGIKSAVSYPLVMIGMMLLVIIVIITKVLPIFNQVFLQLGSEMSGFASSLLSIGNTLNRYSIIIVSFVVLVVLLFLFFTRTRPGRRLIKGFLSKFILTKSFYEDVAIERFSSGMALVMRAGLDTFRGLDMVRDLVEHKKIRGKIDVCRKSMSDNASLPEAIKEAGFYSNLNNRLLEVGFKSGKQDEVLKRIADDYGKSSERKINQIISVIEPTLVIILSIIVGLILLSVILPLVGIMSSIG